MIAASVFALFSWGLKLGIDFTGGSLMEIEYKIERSSSDAIKENFKSAGVDDVHVQPSGDKGVILRFKDVGEDKHQEILSKLKGEDKESLSEKSFASIGPTIGGEMKRKSIWAISLVLAIIVTYIAIAFRKVSSPMVSWKYGIATLIALFHDVIVPLGVFAALGKFYNTEIDVAFIAAILTVLGYSVHDTIIVFDRIRENLAKFSRIEFEEIINKSLNQTFVRSLNTSMTVLLVLLAIYFFGGDTIKNFALVLLIGIAAGTYSSIFVASPILLSWHNWTKRKIR
jgi:preprotein translocase subunit SecF